MPRTRDGGASTSPRRLALATRAQSVKAALRVAVVVGTFLNAVNNGPPLWSHSPVSPWRVALNYLVPFLVASYSAAREEQRRLVQRTGDVAHPGVDR